jgi:hypothetical protein
MYTEALQDRVRLAHDVEPGHRSSGQADQAEAEPVLLVHGVALQEPALGERRDQSRRRRLVHVQTPAQLGDAQLACLCDQLERGYRATDRSKVPAVFVAHRATPEVRRNARR